MFWLGKIIPLLRNSESKASGNKRFSKDPDDQIWSLIFKTTIDGESSKTAASVQQVFIWKY